MWKNVLDRATHTTVRGRIVLTGMIVFTALAGAVVLTAADRSRAKRTVISTENMVYTIHQGGADAGEERVEKTTYSDNLVEYRATIHTRVGDQMEVDEATRLEVEDDSYFPLRYESHKVTRAAGHEIVQDATLQMFANVGVFKLKMTPGNEDVRNIVMPSGTAVLETGVIHHLYALLHAYDDDTGGRQAFDFIDFPRGKLDQGVFVRAGNDTIAVMGKQIPVREYRFERTQYTQKCFVDANGRIVAADFGMMDYTLSSYSITRSE